MARHPATQRTETPSHQEERQSERPPMSQIPVNQEMRNSENLENKAATLKQPTNKTHTHTHTHMSEWNSYWRKVTTWNYILTSQRKPGIQTEKQKKCNTAIPNHKADGREVRHWRKTALKICIMPQHPVHQENTTLWNDVKLTQITIFFKSPPKVNMKKQNKKTFSANIVTANLEYWSNLKEIWLRSFKVDRMGPS